MTRVLLSTSTQAFGSRNAMLRQRSPWFRKEPSLGSRDSIRWSQRASPFRWTSSVLLGKSCRDDSQQDKRKSEITETGLNPDGETVIPADWYAPLAPMAMAGAQHAAHFGSTMYNAEEWCGIDLSVDVSTLEGGATVNWSAHDSEGTAFPWTAGEPLGEFAPLLFPALPAGITGMPMEVGGGYHAPVVVRALAGEYVSFHIGYNAGYASGATGALAISSPMWLNNCGAEPCDAPYEPLCPADVDGNGVVAVSDLLLVLADFGNSCE